MHLWCSTCIASSNVRRWENSGHVLGMSPLPLLTTHRRHHAAKRRTRLISAGEQMGTGGVAVCCGVYQLAVFARIERPQGEWQRLLSLAEIGGVKSSTADLLAFAAFRFRPYRPSPIYWITRSARLSTSGGIVMPMSRAVLRFTISS
jgi:CRISPR/Cas system endoribonuclease Cas6 (RAMP superfamily)